MAENPISLLQPRILQILHQHSAHHGTPWRHLPARHRAGMSSTAKAITEVVDRVISEMASRHRARVEADFASQLEARDAAIREQVLAAARATDPHTSHVAAEDSAARKHHRRLMLRAYWDNRTRAISDHEAADDAGLLIEGICWWKRASDLRQQGLIEWATDCDGKRVTAPGVHGRPVGLCVLTDVGRKAAKREALAAQNC